MRIRKEILKNRAMDEIHEEIQAVGHMDRVDAENRVLDHFTDDLRQEYLDGITDLADYYQKEAERKDRIADTLAEIHEHLEKEYTEKDGIYKKDLTD